MLAYIPWLPVTPILRIIQEEGVTDFTPVSRVDPDEFEGLVKNGAVEVIRETSWLSWDAMTYIPYNILALQGDLL